MTGIAKINAHLFIPLDQDVICAACGAVTLKSRNPDFPALGFQFVWCVHELCVKCAAGVVEACPVCGAAGPDVTMKELTSAALTAPIPVEVPRETLWPWFLVALVLAAVLIVYGNWFAS